MPVYKRGKIWHASASHKGQRLRQAAGTTRAKAKALEAKLIERLTKPSNEIDYELEEIVMIAIEASKNLANYNGILSHARNLLPYIAGRHLSEVHDVVAAVKRMPNKPATINRRLAILRRGLNLALDRGMLDKPVKIQLLRENNQRDVFLSHGQVAALIGACVRPESGQLIRLAAYTGIRAGEMWRLNDIGKSAIWNRAILIDRTKNTDSRRVPASAEVLSIVGQMPLGITSSMLRTDFESARLGVGLSHVRWHDLRHTFASFVLAEGGSLVDVKKLLGHRSLAATQRYVHLAQDHLDQVVARIEPQAKLRKVK